MPSSFLKAPYTDSIVQVKIGEAPGILSDPIPIERRSGKGAKHPQSSNTSINDIFDGIEGLGSEVPGCVDMLDSRQPLLRVPGQLFADDTVGLAASINNLHAMFAHFSQWAEDHYTGFGVKKSGVMALGRHSDVVALREQVYRWRLGGEWIPIVSHYIYLGTLINSDLNMRNIVGDRVKKVGAPLKRSTRC
jgi:hypothetical protein